MTTAIKIDEARYITGQRQSDNKFERIFNDIAKFAVDSTLSGSLKGVTGPKKLYEIVQEKLKTPPTSIPLHNCKKPEDVKLAERMQVRVEEMLEDLEKLKLQNESSAICIERKEPLEKGPNDDSQRAHVLEPEKKRIFIRSRL